MKHFTSLSILKITIFLTVFSITNLWLYSQGSLNPNELPDNTNYFDIVKTFDNYWDGRTPEKGQGWKQFKRWEWFWSSRVDSEGRFPNISETYTEWINYKSKNNNKSILLEDTKWEPLGPVNKPALKPQMLQAGTGRINCIDFDPVDPQILWAGAASGGVWKSSNAGKNWVTFPFTEFLSLGISDIKVAPSNRNVVYAATGDANAGAFFGVHSNYSIGLIKTTDGGITWNQTGFAAQQANGWLINTILVHPTNPNKLFISNFPVTYDQNTSGIWYSSDGGATWTRVLNGFCRDMIFRPGNPDIIYCTLLESDGTNNVLTLRTINFTSGTLSNPFLIPGAARIELAVTSANANYVYALACQSNGGFHSIHRSTDGGQNWIETANASNSPNFMSPHPQGSSQGGQGIYDLCIAASPFSASEILIGGVNIWKSVDAGRTFSLSSDWTGSVRPFVHADQHELAFDPYGVLYSGNDGGISVSVDRGNSWKDISDGLAITQFYDLSNSLKDDKFILAGSQDNGTNLLRNNVWENVFGGDGMQCIVDPDNSQKFYLSLYYGDFKRTTDGGDSFQNMINSNLTGEQGAWVTPIAIDPNNSATMYVGYQNVWRLSNYGTSYQRISNFPGPSLRSIEVAPSTSNTIYVSTNFNGEQSFLYVTHDGGQTWQGLVNSPTVITSIAVDPNKKERVWITTGGYITGLKVFEIDGNKVTNISDGLPNVPANKVVYQLGSLDRLFLGNDLGVWVKERNANWVPVGTDLPNVIVSDLAFHYASGTLRAATYGRGIWQIEVSGCNIAPPIILTSGNTKFCDGDSVILEVDGEYNKYLWSTGETTKSITVKQTGKYSCEITDSTGCRATSEIIDVLVYSIPRLEIRVSGNNNPKCEGDTIRLTPSLGYNSYTWSTGETEKNIEIWEPGLYKVTCVTDEGCTNEEEIEITEIPKPKKPEVQWDGVLLSSSIAKGYQWYMDYKKVNGATQKTYKPVADGYYQVVITSDNGCENFSDGVDVSVTSVSDEQSDQYVSIIPNPNTGIFRIIIYNTMGDAVIQISDVPGNSIYMENAKVNSNIFEKEINLGNISSGVYFIKIISRNKSYFRNFIVE